MTLNPNPPQRPDCCSFDSMASMHAEFERLRSECSGAINSSCGHKILIFDHHIFHLASISRPGVSQLSMPGERAGILRTVQGYGEYVVHHEGSRARNLPSAFQTMSFPDEVWLGNPKVATAKWVYIKQFDSKSYAYTVALIGERPEENGIIVPFSSFPCRKRDLRKWRQGELQFKQERPPEGDQS